MTEQTDWPNYVPGFADWTAIQALDDFEFQIDAGLANAKLVIDEKPVHFVVLEVRSLNRCIGDEAIAMSRLSSVTALLNEFIDNRNAIERVRDVHSVRESLVYSNGTCRECQVAYPCDTIIALDGDE